MPGTNFQCLALSQKHDINVCHTTNQYLTKFNFNRTKDSKKEINKNKKKCNFHYVAMSMIASQILKFTSFTKTEKARCLKNKTLFFLEIKKSLMAHQGLFYGKKYFSSGDNLKFYILLQYFQHNIELKKYVKSSNWITFVFGKYYTLRFEKSSRF